MRFPFRTHSWQLRDLNLFAKNREKKQRTNKRTIEETEKKQRTNEQTNERRNRKETTNEQTNERKKKRKEGTWP
jgi:hypothetical protein